MVELAPLLIGQPVSGPPRFGACLSAALFSLQPCIIQARVMGYPGSPMFIEFDISVDPFDTPCETIVFENPLQVFPDGFVPWQFQQCGKGVFKRVGPPLSFHDRFGVFGYRLDIQHSLRSTGKSDCRADMASIA